MPHICIYGPPGSGKSTVGSLLAYNLNLPFIDLDVEIERAAGRSIPQIMKQDGEPTFRDLESAALDAALSASDAVIALGGGALLRDENRAHAESAGRVVLLEADLSTLLARLESDENQRPLLAGDLEEKLKGLMDRRAAHYQSFPLRIANIDKPEDKIWDIQRQLGWFHVCGMGAGYDVIIQKGGLDALGTLLKERSLDPPFAVVSDSNVAGIYGERVLASLHVAEYESHLLTFPAGEGSKTLETVTGLWRGFLEAGLDRRSTIIALGGGVTGDLAGFAASTFMRGVSWVGVPTSLLAMADSSLGGKTGFDLPEGKNLVGSFHPPRLVLADPDVLSTLPDEEFHSGLAEVVKHGVIADPALFELCASGPKAVSTCLPEIVSRAMAVKVKVIEADPFERGLRASLNLGHTVGHALEKASDYRLRHGEAISIGMVVEARLAERLGLADGGLSETIGVALADLGLPTQIPGDLPCDEIIRLMRVDKKKAAGVVRFALPVRIGQVQTGVAVEDLSLVFS
jgi:3-dehydroquinate synthase